jgi:hypothetical protein
MGYHCRPSNGVHRMKRTQADWEAITAVYTANELALMREWVCECAADSDDLEERESAPAWQIVKYVARCFDGGLSGFMECIQPV